MNRRDFLRYGVSCLMGILLGEGGNLLEASVKELCWWLCQEYGLDPLKKGVIVGHRDLNDTECPGKNLYKKLGEIRRFCFDRTNP